MAKKSIAAKQHTGSDTPIATIETTEKTGSAQRFAELARRNPKVRVLQGYISDAEKRFKGKPDKLDAFYTTMEAACMLANLPAKERFRFATILNDTLPPIADLPKAQIAKGAFICE